MDFKTRSFPERKRGFTPDPNSKFAKFISNSSDERAESEWGSRDRRSGFLDHSTLKETEKLFGLSKNEPVSYGEIPVEVPEEFPQMVNFSDIDVHATLLKNIEKMNYTNPTPVQKHAIPISVLRRDLMACAQTGSGKTAAFIVPIVAKMLNDGPPAFTNNRAALPSSLILAPTRELSIQIYEEALKFTYRTGMRVVVVYGGSDPRFQSGELRKGADVIIATPGRLIDFLKRGTVELRIVRYLVLDEADRMLDMGFEPQLQEILSYIPYEDRETAMFSATFPKDIQNLASQYLKNYIFLSIGRVGSTNEMIRQEFEFIEEHCKTTRLLTLLGEIEGLVLGNS